MLSHWSRSRAVRVRIPVAAMEIKKNTSKLTKLSRHLKVKSAKCIFDIIAYSYRGAVVDPRLRSNGPSRGRSVVDSHGRSVVDSQLGSAAEIGQFISQVKIEDTLHSWQVTLCGVTDDRGSEPTLSCRSHLYNRPGAAVQGD